MAFLRAFRITNRYISFHVLLLLRFYLAQFYYLGLLRTRYKSKTNAVYLTHYSVVISRMIGLFFGYFLSVALLTPYVNLLYLQPYLFVCCLLWQPRHNQERKIRLINGFLRLAPKLYRCSRSQLKLSWLLVAQLLLKLFTFKLYMLAFQGNAGAGVRLAILLIYSIPFTLAIWCLDMCGNLLNICLSLLMKSFEQLNSELDSQSEQMHLKILQADYGAVRRIQQRIRCLQRLYASYAALTQQLLDCLAPQILLILVYNLSMIFALSYARWRRLIDICMLANGLRLLLQALDALVVTTITPQDTAWTHFARQLQLNEVLEMHGWVQSHCTDLDIDTYEKSMRRSLLQPRLQVLGLFTPNRRFYFRLLFSYCTFVHLHYMLSKQMPVKEREIFNILFSNLRFF